ncbi:MAG: tetratricopeptide repeat protein [Acidobacteriota bacterium]|nr:MAG: tetratricopeptide repeat protein [Acidobacteriota bacterium]
MISRTVFSLVLLFFIAGGSASFVYGQGRLALTWEVVKYDITTTLPADFRTGRELDVDATLTIKNISRNPASTVSLRISDQAAVSSVAAGGAAADFRSSPETTSGARPLQRTVVSVPSVAPGGNIVVAVKYKLAVRENDGLAALSYAGSQFLPFSFWYPTPTSWFYTGGADFAPVKIKINGGGLSAGTGSNGSFDLSLNGQPFFVAGQYEERTVNGVVIAYPRRGTSQVSPGRLNRLAEIATKADAFISSRLGSSLEAPLKIICVKRGSGFADSGTMLVDDSVLVREKPDSSAVQTIVEGIAKSHLGNVISVSGDGYGVIREGLSRFISNEFIEQEFGEEAAEVERLRQRASYATISGRDAPLNIVSPVDGYFFTATANKGAIIFSYLASRSGDRFYNVIREMAADKQLSLAELRSAFPGEKEYLDYTLDRVTQMNLMVGLPVKANGRTRSALRNMGEVDARVEVVGTTASGGKLRTPVTVKANEFGEVYFDSAEEVVRVEVDAAKVYPQTDYTDDVAPRVVDEPDPLLFVKREFDRQKYAEAEKNAEAVLSQYPAFHDVRVLLARSQLALGKVTEARSNFEQVLALALPSPQSIAWSELGLGEIASRTGQASDAAGRFREAIASDADYGATLGAVRDLIAAGGSSSVSEEVRSYFAAFDRAVVSNSKAQVDEIIAGGEVTRFASSVVGQAQQWATTVRFVQEIDGVDIVVGTNVQLKLLNREVETGVAMFRLSRTPSGLKLVAVDVFEVS